MCDINEIVVHSLVIVQNKTQILNFMKIRPVWAELCRADGRTGEQTDRQTERPTDMMKLTVTFRSFANAPKIDRTCVALAFEAIRKSSIFASFILSYTWMWVTKSICFFFFCSGLFKVGSFDLRHYLFSVGTYVLVYIASHFGSFACNNHCRQYLKC